MDMIRILVLADTHLGFDYPFRPRVRRRRRGLDFFKNYGKALEPALAGTVDAIIHAGDLFFRSKVPAELVGMAFEPLKKAADLGVQVYIVPGNHERSHIPFGLLALHEKIHIFSQPKTFLLNRRGVTLALSGFPFCRNNVRGRFPELLEQTAWKRAISSQLIHLLCVHQAFEGAKVGPVNYTFRSGEDVIRTAEIPEEFSAVLAGHIHRHQVLRTGLNGNRLRTPIFIPGSTERTSFAEKEETKGYLILELDHSALKGNVLSRWHFQELPARPMKKIEIDVTGLTPHKLRLCLKAAFGRLEPDSVVKIVISGSPERACLPIFRAAELRSICPEGMNTELSFASETSLTRSVHQVKSRWRQTGNF